MADVAKTIPQQVSDVIAEAMFRAKEAKGIVLAIATADGGVLMMGAGEFVTKLGLFRALEEKASEAWCDADEVEDYNG